MKRKILCIAISLMLMLMILPAFAEEVIHSKNFSSTVCLRHFTTSEYINRSGFLDWGNIWCHTSFTLASNPSNLTSSYAEALNNKTSKTAMSDVIEIPNTNFGYYIPLYSSASSETTMIMRIYNPYFFEPGYGDNNTINMQSSGIFWSSWQLSDI
jgi:hypothetical protein